MTPLRLVGVRKSFCGRQVVAIDHLELVPGELLALLGPSGCGKSTTLRLIAGLETPDVGSIVIRGVEVVGDRRWVPTQRRRVGLVFQDHALFPHLTVAGNIAYGLPRGRQRAVRVSEMLDLVGLTGHEQAYPRQLSGGQQQRVALARSLAPAPDLLLLDEPFSSLDPGLRQHLRDEVRSILQRTRTTGLLVTHDQEEALSMADRIAVMLDGTIAQIDTPPHIYRAPATLAVASFIGDANVLAGQANEQGIQIGLGVLDQQTLLRGPVVVVVRPESVELDSLPLQGTRGVVISVSYLGHYQMTAVRLDSTDEVITARMSFEPSIKVGQIVGVRVVGPALVYDQD